MTGNSEPLDLKTQIQCARAFLKSYYTRQAALCEARLANFDRVNWNALDDSLLKLLEDRQKSAPKSDLMREIVGWLENTLTD